MYVYVCMEMLEVSFRLLAELWTSEIAGLPACVCMYGDVGG